MTQPLTATSLAAMQPPAEPWWKVRMLWLVIGGPLAVVVASVATLALAITHPDPVLSVEPAHKPGERPAIEGRNHAATLAADAQR